MFQLVLTAALFAVAFSMPASPKEECGFPNNTDTAFHFYNCAPADAIQVQSVTITDDQGNSNYPINPHKPINLKLVSYDSGPDYVSDKVNVKLYEYTANWLTGKKCKWAEIPTFGLLNNLDGCQFASNCPLKHGTLNLDLKLDLSSYAAIIALLAGNKSYEIEVHMFDNNPGSQKEEIACVVTQLKFDVK